MDIKEVIENAGEALSDSVEKVTASISPGLSNLAETQLGKQVASIVSTAGEKAEEAISKAGDALEKSHVKEAAQSVSLPAPAADLVDKTKEAVHSSDHSGTRKAVIVGGAVAAAGAAAAAGVVVYRRRRASQAEDDAWVEEGEGGAVVTPIQPNAADDAAAAHESGQPADQEDQVTDTTTGFGAQLDAEAEHFVQDLIDHIDDEEVVGGVLDLDYAIELDAEADHFAKDFVDHIEVTDADVAAAGEELEKQG